MTTNNQTTIHLTLTELGDGQTVRLRYYRDNPNDFQERRLPMTAIQALLDGAEDEYYTPLPAALSRTGQQLYQWLDSAERLWESLWQAVPHDSQTVILAINSTGRLSHLPWELLHDGRGFLVQHQHPRLLPMRWLDKPYQPREPANHALSLLFMATSPTDLGAKAVLAFEAEEARILQATQTLQQQLDLQVEESGNLEELGLLLGSYPADYFDIFHLTGHATITPDGPRFLTETLTGGSYLASAADIRAALKQMPRLIFLSGCHTGQAHLSRELPSMAEALLKQGAGAVLGWGRPVRDTEATQAAATLYAELSSGQSLAPALTATYQALLKENARDWHLLRLYGVGAMPGPLVTPANTSGRKPARPPSVTNRFLDEAQQQVKVATREAFVGRRRLLQRGVRALRSDTETIGLLLHGMGGLGKSTLAARLCDRLREHTPVIMVGLLDEPSLVNQLGQAVADPEWLASLQDPATELVLRLQMVLAALHQQNKKLLLVLDDFESNLEARQGAYILQPEAQRVLTALTTALRESNSAHRVIITCRYRFEAEALAQFKFEQLSSLPDPDVQKKVNRLEEARRQTASQPRRRWQKATPVTVQPLPAELKAAAVKVADGNPRLLEWLFKLLSAPDLSQADYETLLERMAETKTKFREDVLAAQLLAQQTAALRQLLRRLLIYRLPVPYEAVQPVALADFPADPPLTLTEAELDHLLERASDVGLLEIIPPTGQETDGLFRVPRILQSVLWPSPQPSPPGEGATTPSSVPPGEGATTPSPVPPGEGATTPSSVPPLPQGEGRGEGLTDLAARILYRLWWKETDTKTEPRALEIHRLALAAAETTILIELTVTVSHNWLKHSRFREALALTKQSRVVVEDDYRLLHRQALSEMQLGQMDDALSHYHQALATCPPKDKHERAAIIHNLAITYRYLGQTKKAKKYLCQSLDIKIRIDDLQGTAATIHEIAIIYGGQRQFKKAMNMYNRCLKITKKLNDFQGQAVILHNMGRIYAKQRQFEKAINMFCESLKITKRIGDYQGQAAFLQSMAYIYGKLGRKKKADSLYHHSLKIDQQIGDYQGQAGTLGMLGLLLARERKFETAMDYLQRSLAILRQLRSPDAATVEQILVQVALNMLAQDMGAEEVQALLKSDPEQVQTLINQLLG